MSSLNIETWSPDEVAKWIKGLGAQYKAYHQSFVDEEITGKALLTINAEYLKELSIENTLDQNVILEGVHCLLEVDTCLQGETVHGQVVIVNENTKTLIDQLEKEGKEANEGDLLTSEDSTKAAGQVYQLAKKLLSWLIRAPFSEMNACWPLKDSVCRVVRDMTDETLLKNRGHLLENLKKLHISFDNFLSEKELHEVFKQPPILKTEKITLEGEGLGIGITTSHNIHTVNSVAAESPAGKNKNIKNGDEIVNVNDQCVIAWPQKNVVALMKSNPDCVTLTLKKLPLVEGPLNKPVDKQGTPLNEMDVVIDRARITTERSTRVEMKEAGIKEETSLEMQAIENENEAEEAAKVENRIGEAIKEEPVEAEGEGGKENDKEEAKKEEVEEEQKEDKVGEEDVEGKETGDAKEVQNEQKIKEGEEIDKEDKGKEQGEKVEDETNGVPESAKSEEMQDKVDEVREEEGVVEKQREEVPDKKFEGVRENEGKATEKSDAGEEESSGKGSVIVEGKGAPEHGAKVVENLVQAEDASSKDGSSGEVTEEPVAKKEEAQPKVEGEKSAGEKEEKIEDSKDVKAPVANGESADRVEKIKEDPDKDEPTKITEVGKDKSKTPPSKAIWYDGETEIKANTEENVENAAAAKRDENSPATAPAKSSHLQQNGEAESSPIKSDSEPRKAGSDKKPARPELPKMKMGSVKNITVGGATAKQVEILSAPKVVRRDKKVGDAPNKRISCIELGDADCEGWLTKKSGGHGLTPTRWRRQWCVLKEEHMYYYKTSFDREAGGVIEITGYTVTAAPEVKKSFAFKCEKDGGKKYFFHADNEVDREMWIRNLNLAARGEKKAKDVALKEQSNDDERKSSVSLKPPAPNRPRSSSVLAGIRFNYYDDELGDDTKNQQTSPTAVTAQRVNDGLENGEKEALAGDKKPADTGVLKISVGVEQDADTCQVVPVEELQDSKGTEGTPSVDEGSAAGGTEDGSDAKEVVDEAEIKEPEGASQEKGDSKEPGGPAGDDGDSKPEDAEDKSGNQDKASEAEVVNGESKEPARVSEVKLQPEGVDSTSEVKADGKETEGTSEVKSSSKGLEESPKVTSESKEPDSSSEAKSESAEPESTTEEKKEHEEPAGTSEEKSESKEPVDTSEVKSELKGSEGTSEEKSEKAEELEKSKEDNSATKAAVQDEGREAGNSDSGVEDTVCEQDEDDKNDKGSEGGNDDFQEVAESIKEAEVNIDGSERPSPKALLRRLSTNSKDEIMDKVVKLRVLKQSLKDKEQTMAVIDELLTSDVTPETIGDWRTKFETIVESSTNSSELNENSQL